MVYFLQSDVGGPVKIGTTGDNGIPKRLKEVQVGYPWKLRVVALRPGGRSEEEDLHWQFASCRMAGEWFLPRQDLLDYIAAECEQLEPVLSMDEFLAHVAQESTQPLSARWLAGALATDGRDDGMGRYVKHQALQNLSVREAA